MDISNISVDEKRMKQAKKQLGEWKNDINKELEKEFKDHKRRGKRVHSEGVKAIEYLEEYTMRGGKRIRPALVIAGYKAVGGKKYKNILSASLSMEALQSYLLIHDDVMDKDDLRRGKPSLHKMYEKYFNDEKKGKDPEWFGKSMAINVGDLANSFAIDQMAKSDFDAEIKIKAIRKLEQIHRYTGFGQILDVTLNHMDADQVTEEDVMTVYQNKTAHYTLAGPLELGCIIAGGSKKQQKALHEYGMNVGKGFQAQDDMLVMYGDEEKLGKEIGTDLREGNKTLIIIKALENANNEQKQKIKNALGNEDLTSEEVKEIAQIAIDTGARDYTQKKAEKLINKGKRAIKDNEDIDPEIRDFLLGLADYIITREV